MQFIKAYRILINDRPTADIDKELIKLRFNLMKEENEEYFEAARKNDIVEMAMLVICCTYFVEQ